MGEAGNDTQDRRRGQRAFLVMPLAVSWTTPGGLRIREHAQTEEVSATGAMLRMNTRIPSQGVVILDRLKLNQSAQARVVSVVEASEDGGYRVAVEFLRPNRSFWGITFPPSLCQEEVLKTA